MAQMLAPYNNAMRLGQGFNSYTQQICLDQAVLLDTQQNRGLEEKRIAKLKTSTAVGGNPASGLGGVQSLASSASSEGDAGPLIEGGSAPQQQEGPPAPKQTEKTIQVPGWVKPQIVTYSSRFVDKLSDVTDAMNISGSLSIKTATIGGKANGSYVDSDKFQSSDIKFHLQVKVTNQIHHAPNYTVFNKIETLPDAEYPEVYGDSFISGWEEGGELNAIISVKVRDKSKIFEIKVKIEAELTQPTVAGSVSGQFEMEKNRMSKETETTITVNWSGGGSIKDPTEDWTIASIKKAAAAFPELVAITPQRTYAILTKYTALESFHRQANRFSLLDYENAGIYTNSLLDRYMDYKALWKQISVATIELEGNRADIELSEPDEDTYKLALVKALPADQRDVKMLIAKRQMQGELGGGKGPEQSGELASTIQHGSSILDSSGNSTSGSSANDTLFKVFPASFAGLIEARQVCRAEMVKIVNEVDIVSKVPTMATDIRRDHFFLNPIVFKQLLPVVRSKSAEDAILEVKDPHAPLLLGYVAPPADAIARVPVYHFDSDIKDHPIVLQKSVQKVAHRANNYRMRGCAGSVTNVHSQAKFFNDLLKLNATFRPLHFSAWTVDNRLSGLQIQYSSEDVSRYGICDGLATHTLELENDGSEIISEISITEGKDGTGMRITAISVATSLCRVLDTTTEPNPPETAPVVKDAAKPDKKTESTATGTAPSSAPATDTPAAATTESAAPTTSTTPAASATPAASTISTGATAATGTSAPPPGLTPLTNVRKHTWSRPNDGQWSLRGFFGFTQLNATSKKEIIISLGVVWGKDTFVPVPNARIVPPLSKQYINLSPALQKNIEQISETTTFEGKFLMGNSVSVPEASDDAEVFNALDRIDYNWRIKEIAFACQDGRLSGLQVRYQTGDVLVHGNFTENTKVWNCDVKTSLVRAKITAGRLETAGPAFIDTIEFIRNEPDGQLPAWPLNISTLRYLGEGEKRVSVDAAEVVEIAPTFGSKPWFVQGFFGERSGGIVTRLGIIWGRGG